MAAPQYRCADPLEAIYEEFEKQYLQIPADDDGGRFFFRPQKAIYDKLPDGYLSYSGPTSMGKSLIMRAFIKSQILKGSTSNFAILVPTKALLNEVRSSLIRDIGDRLISCNYRVVTSAKDLLLEKNHHFIFIMTPERFLQLLIKRKDIDIEYLFIDEAHKISSKGDRSSFYYKVVDMLFEKQAKPHVVFASPNIPNPEIYLNLIPEQYRKNIHAMTSSFAPVVQHRFVIDLAERKAWVYNQRKPTMNTTDEDDRCEDICVIDPSVNFANLLYGIGKDKQNIVYCSSKDKAIILACEYANSLPELYNKELDQLSADIKKQIHSEYFLADLVKKGIAYHVGYLPANLRMRIEESFKEGDIRTIFCTSTLVEGVNLPADNLFITSYKNGTSNLSQVEFQNLVGRVGRIEYNLSGNVFLVRMEDGSVKENFVSLLDRKIEDQKLSIDGRLGKKEKRAVVESLLDPDMGINEVWTKASFERFTLMRRFSLILAKDIVEDKASSVREGFKSVITEDEEQTIRENVVNRPSSDDIILSYDQYESLCKAVSDGLVFPEIPKDNKFTFDTLFPFLLHLEDVFNWEKYEKKYLGKRNKEGEFGKLKWYSVVLSQWMSGFGLSQIITSSIEYKRRNKESGVWLDGVLKAPVYEDTPVNNNYVIADVLSTLENIVLFSIANYFRELSDAIKRGQGVDSIDNDWSDYVEYGSTDPVVQYLQRAGFSREAAQYIKNHPDSYTITQNGDPLLLKDALMKCDDPGIINEVEDARTNYPELFAPLNNLQQWTM